jgi:hypothetical protein
METYSWSKLYPEHCSDEIISVMISENVHILWDEIPDATDFVDALACLHSEDSRRWLLDEFQDSRAGFNESYLKEYVEFFGADEFFYQMLQEADITLSHDFLMDVLEIGVEDDDLPMLFGRYYGTFSGEEIEKLFDFYDVPDEYAKVFLSERIEGELSYDQIYTILDHADEKLYPLLRPFIKRLPFEKRMDLMDVFDIEL